jgi:hypothetical protein
VGGARSSDVIFGHISFGVGVGSSGGGQLDDGAARRSMSRACNNEEAKEVTRGSGDRTSDVKLKKLARVAR